MKTSHQIQRWFVAGFILLAAPAFSNPTPQHSKIPPSLDASLKELKQVSAELMKLKEAWLKVDPAGLKDDLQKYKTVSDAREKFILSVSLAFRKKQMEIAPQTNAIKLTQNEKKILNDAAQDSDRTVARVKEFEKKLTPSDIANITADNPNSFYRDLGRFEMHRPPSCDIKAYTQMRKKVPFHALFQGGMESSLYIKASEGLYSRSYNQKINQLLKTDPRFVAYRPLADTFYALTPADLSSVTHVTTDNVKEANQKQVDRITKEWSANGVPADQVRKVAFSFGEQSPECLGQFDPRFFDVYKMELTLIRGHRLLRKVRDYYVREGALPENLRSFALQDTTDPLFQSDEDGWYGTYVVEHDANKIRVRAYGPDKAAKKPSLLVGELPLK
jgi:hypothetical protein